jgi:hypothetical protein
MTNKPRTFGGLRSAPKPGLNCPQKVRGKKRGAGKIITIVRGPMKLRPTQAHKNKRAYSRKNEKTKLKSLIEAS